MAGEGFYRGVISGLFYGQTFQNVLHFLGPSADQGALAVLANEIETIWINRVRTIQSQSFQYVQIRTIALDTNLAPRTKPISIQGSSSQSDEIDPTACYILRLRTLNASRHGRGRVYLGGIFVNQYQFGVARANLVNLVNTLSEQILGDTGFDSSIFKLCVGNSKPPFVFTGVDHIEIGPHIGHQRRRNIGVGI